MPRGTYRHTDPDTAEPLAVEKFDCGLDSGALRYSATLRRPGGEPLCRVMIRLDGAGRQARVELASGGWTVRGGVAGTQVLWVRAGGGERVEHVERAAGFDGLSAGFSLAAAWALRPRAEVGVARHLRLVELTVPALGGALVERTWTLTGVAEHDTVTGSLAVAAWRVDDRATGVSREAHVAGDVIVYATGLELVDLDSPPDR